MTIIQNGQRRVYDVRLVNWQIRDLRTKISRIDYQVASMGRLMDLEGSAQCENILRDIDKAKEEKQVLQKSLKDLLARR